jgi:antitoxin component YwqK of YwqJK toxin-antitoxin module
LSSNLIDGKRHGDLRVWNDEGVLIKLYPYCHDNIHGTLREWYDNGKKKLTCEYVHGKKHGPEYKWSMSRITPGEYIKYTEFYSNDVNITEEIKKLVSTIHHFTDQEKTSIALNYGFDVC